MHRPFFLGLLAGCTPLMSTYDGALTGDSDAVGDDTETVDTSVEDSEEPIDTEEPDTEASDTEAVDTEAVDTEEPDTEEPDTEVPTQGSAPVVVLSSAELIFADTDDLWWFGTLVLDDDDDIAFVDAYLWDMYAQDYAGAFELEFDPATGVYWGGAWASETPLDVFGYYEVDFYAEDATGLYGFQTVQLTYY